MTLARTEQGSPEQLETTAEWRKPFPPYLNIELLSTNSTGPADAKTKSRYKLALHAPARPTSPPA